MRDSTDKETSVTGCNVFCSFGISSISYDHLLCTVVSSYGEEYLVEEVDEENGFGHCAVGGTKGSRYGLDT